ncbi:tyrosine phenol-lyase [Chitinophaga niastensis]|uniref:Tyrosine phenol-lyase n=1 Tax=Chitinophaga niastensis TaxID=536980 RepID=A0A2P8HH61_CHINA|nr:tyrosine phenol-lyase [Chitinophaga niastensis]PSL45562.1 tyrosine phenol-lyase [Chitinophaga niastensis]
MDDNEMTAEPYKIKMIEHLKVTSREEREQFIREAGYNVFNLRSDDVYLDFLTDSGTSAMSEQQWAGMMLGDESYAGSRNFYHLESVVKEYYGYNYVVPTHQGRGAEHIIARMLIRPGTYIPGNMYFTTTRAHQELAGGTFADIIIDEAHQPSLSYPFKGNVDLQKLRDLIARVGAANIPYVSIATTVNMAGGQPISLGNLKQVRELTQQHGIKIIHDMARVAENAYMIQQYEPGYSDKPVAAIVREICALTDGATMSGKKDALVNIGGFLALNDLALYEEAINLVVLYEGLHTYGGMAGRDMEAMAIGITESVNEKHISARIKQVQYLGKKLLDGGVPIVLPVGTHGVYIDATAFLPHLSQLEFPAQALTIALYKEGGIRSMERGIVSAGRDQNTGEHIFPKMELVRMAIPRRVYTNLHISLAAEIAIKVYENRNNISGLKMVYEPKYLRFFQARFEPL